MERTGPSFCWGLSSCGFSFCTWPPAQRQLPPPFTSLLHPAPDTHAQAYAPTLSSSPYGRSSRTSLLDKVWFPPANIALTEFPVFGQQIKSIGHHKNTHCGYFIFCISENIETSKYSCYLHLTICAGLSYQMNFKSDAWLGHLLVIETFICFHFCATGTLARMRLALSDTNVNDK